MRQFIFRFAVAVVMIAIAASPAPAQKKATGEKPEVKKPGEKFHRLVFPIRHRDPKQVANSIARFLSRDVEAQIQPVPNSNLLLIRVEGYGLKEVLELLKQLDQPPRLVQVNIWIAELKTPAKEKNEKAAPIKLDEADWSGPMEQVERKLKQWTREKKIESLNRIEFKTLENQPVKFTRGTTKAIVVGGDPRRGSSTRYKEEGASVEATPRAGGKDQILINLKIGDVRNVTPKNGVPIGADGAGNPIIASESIVQNLDTSLQIPSGQAVLARGVQSRSQSGELRQFLVIVAAKFGS